MRSFLDGSLDNWTSRSSAFALRASRCVNGGGEEGDGVQDFQHAPPPPPPPSVLMLSVKNNTRTNEELHGSFSPRGTYYVSADLSCVRARWRDGAMRNSDAAAWWMCGVGSGLSGWTAFRRNPGVRFLKQDSS